MSSILKLRNAVIDRVKDLKEQGGFLDELEERALSLAEQDPSALLFPVPFSSFNFRTAIATAVTSACAPEDKNPGNLYQALEQEPILNEPHKKDGFLGRLGAHVEQLRSAGQDLAEKSELRRTEGILAVYCTAFGIVEQEAQKLGYSLPDTFDEWKKSEIGGKVDYVEYSRAAQPSVSPIAPSFKPVFGKYGHSQEVSTTLPDFKGKSAAKASLKKKPETPVK